MYNDFESIHDFIRAHAMEPITVVLADDHAVFREGIRNLLEQQRDIRVVGQAGNGHEAVAAVRALKPDIVLMDVVMPRLNGIEATKQIKRTNPTTAVLILSAYDHDRYVLGLLDAGAAGYLLKNATGQEVIQAIRSVHAGEAVLHPAVAARLLARAARHLPRPAPVDSEEPLTGRELEVLKFAARGHSNQEIANEIVVSVPTVKAHLVNIFNKLGVGSRTEAVMYGLRMGWLVVEDEPQDSFG
jgi:NarL family two-component system response regulator LiaR